MKQEIEPNSYQSILKATSIYGFVQILKVLIGVVSTKLIAVFLGASGIGFLGLLNNTIGIISSITGFGINVVAVRDLSLESSTSNSKIFSKRYQIIQKWALFAGILGCLITIIFSKLLSQWTFGNPKYYFWFILLSINFVINAISNVKSVLMQSKRMIKQIALANVVTSFFVVLITVPIYYFFKFQAIIPVILMSSAIALFVNIYYTRKIEILKIDNLHFNELFFHIKPLMKLGFLLSINVIFGQICNFIIRFYLKSINSSLEVLGYYEVSSVLLLSYVGLVFGAMSTDFYPRLTSVVADNKKVKSLVNDQIEIGLLIITPLIILFYSLAPIIITILYSKDFLNVILILKAGLLAIILKSIIWPLAFVFLSKGENKLYFKQEIFSDFLNVSLTILMYYYFGLIGIGFAMLINYVIYGVYVLIILKQKFEFTLRKNTLKVVVSCMTIGVLACVLICLFKGFYMYIGLSILVLISFINSFIELNRRIDLSEIFLKIKNKFKKN